MSPLRLIAVLLLLVVVAKIATAVVIPPAVKQTVAFLYLPDTSGVATPLGTAFFVGHVDAAHSDRVFFYLVTAKHVLRLGDRQSFLPSVMLRVNTTNGESEMVPLPIVAVEPGQTVFFHEDPSVDLAVITILFDQKRYSILPLPTELLTTRKDLETYGLSEGTDVFFTGLFTQHAGAKQNLPIVRFGKVALMTDEPINFGGVPAKLYLMEANAFGGNSGSPVFFYPGIDHSPGHLTVGGEPLLRIAGVVSGGFNDILLIDTSQNRTVPALAQNNGIMAVVPAYQLREIIFGPALTEIRRQDLENREPPQP